MRVAIVIEYDGTNYCGWQSQKNGVSIQETIQNAIFVSLGERACVTSSGRTDSGVHALGQVAHFDIEKPIPPSSVAYILNANLPSDIRIIRSFEVDKNFHARYSVKRKKYAYRAYIDTFERPLSDRYAVRINDVDLQKMENAKQLLIGTHDFKAFSASGTKVKDFVRTIYAIEITKSDNLLKIEVEGSGFLYNMVRIIVGTLIEIGYSQRDISCITEALTQKKRNLLGKTMPAKGLTLISVEY